MKGIIGLRNRFRPDKWNDEQISLGLDRQIHEDMPNFTNVYSKDHDD